MDIKSKGWTAFPLTKICCVLLFPVMMFLFLCGAYSITLVDTGAGINDTAGLLFSNLSDNKFFYDSFVPKTYEMALTLFRYRSEQSIENGEHLEWRQISGSYEKDDPDASPALLYEYELYSNNPFSIEYYWGTVDDPDDIEDSWVKIVERNAINQQLDEYYRAQEWLNSTDGLYFRLFDGEWTLENLSEPVTADFFLNQPVYLINESGMGQEKSQPDIGTGFSDLGYRSEFSLYIAFSAEAVEYYNNLWASAQNRLYSYAALIISTVICALVLFVILMFGAGRKHGEECVVFTLLDKPWLDLSLAVTVGIITAVFFGFIELVETTWRYNNPAWILAFCALLSILTTLPFLWWTSSFAKRIKAGKWWRHSLIFIVTSACVKSTVRLLRSLWAGVNNTFKVVLIGILLFLTVTVTSAADPAIAFPAGILATAAAVVLMLRYARRLYLIEQGAKSITLGSYDTVIPVTGGTLGGIAGSLNDISNGISDAVYERLKSERLKTELITNVSHDIRTPLTSLVTYTDLLKTEGLKSKNAPEYLEVLIQKTARLKTLTDDLFEAAKAASGNIQAHIESLDLSELIGQVLGELDEKVQNSGLDFRLNLQERAMIDADGKLLWRVMDNLLSNVFKYSLAASRVYIDVASDNDWYRMDVKNISEYPLNVDPSELIERFKRGDDARGGEGSGLGLAIAQSFIQTLGGIFNLSIDGDLFKVTIMLPKSRHPLPEKADDKIYSMI